MLSIRTLLVRCCPVLVCVLLLHGAAHAQTRQQKLLKDKLRFETIGSWFYNDLEKGFEEARQQNQPVLVVLRCIPCSECVKLDDDLIEADPKLQKLLESFVRVRVVAANGLDLSRFQFDTDQSFAVFVCNADGTLYCRYGTRSDQTEWKDDVSVAGLYQALQAALELHRNYPSNQSSLRDKQAKNPLFASPENIPSLSTRFKSKIDYEGDTAKSCIHCHMIGDGLISHARNESGTIPSSLMMPYPHPKTFGLVLDPTQCATVKAITENSIAERSGFRAGDRIVLLEGQPILSIADVQWVLHHLPDARNSIQATVDRGAQRLEISVEFPDQWRTQEDARWRVSRWQLRQFGFGGMQLEPASEGQRKEIGIDSGKMALRVEHIGEYAPHDVAKKAGMKKGDIIITYDERTDFLRETDLLVYAINTIKIGRSVAVLIRRGGEEKTIQIVTSK